MGRGKSAVKKRAKKIRAKNEANLERMKEIGAQLELQKWKTDIVAKKKAPKYV